LDAGRGSSDFYSLSKAQPRSWSRAAWLREDENIIMIYGGVIADTYFNPLNTEYSSDQMLVYDLVRRQWSQQLNPAQICASNKTTCADAQKLDSLYNGALQNITAILLNLTSSFYRPNNTYQVIQNVLQLGNSTYQQALSLNASYVSRSNNDSTCTTLCTKHITDPLSNVIWPRPLTGQNMIFYNDMIFTLFGESCWLAFTEGGGLDCFNNDIHIFYTTTMTWRRMSQPQPFANGTYASQKDADQAALWVCKLYISICVVFLNMNHVRSFIHSSIVTSYGIVNIAM
jgi:hypothetical protein